MGLGIGYRALRGGCRLRSRGGTALSLIALVIPIAGAAGEGRPRLLVDESVAADFEALALETWDEFQSVFAARTDCFGDVYLHAAHALEARAAYDPATATVTVHVPATRAMLQGALIHEWAHHIEFQCPAHAALRPRFLAALGQPPDTPWRPDDLPATTPTDAWDQIPSEHYAEATISLVLGRNQIPTKIRVGQAEVAAIAAWAAGD